jgi:surface carbohydrate biosynthesis protein
VNLLMTLQYVARELDFKILLATRLAEPGRTILVGHRRVVLRLIRFFEGGLFIGKDIIKSYRTHELHNLQRVKKQGFDLVHLDEEGAVYSGDEAHFARMLLFRLDPTVLSPTDWICTWGRFQEGVYRDKVPDRTAQVVATGHPRFDTLASPHNAFHQNEAAALRARFGDFFLVCTNFQRANHLDGPKRIFERPGRLFDPEEYGRERFLMEWSHAQRTLSRFVELVHAMHEKHPDRNIVVRPHPTENMDTYRAAFSGLDRVFVDRSLSVQPWLVACTAMLHNGCTTGIEGWLAQKPAINYRPEPSALASKRLPAELSLNCDTEAECLKALDRVVAGDFQPVEASAWARGVLSNLEGPALENFVEVLEKAMAAQKGPFKAPGPLKLSALALAEGRIQAAQELAQRKRSKTEALVFPAFEEADLGDRFARANHTLGRDVKWRLLGPRLLMVQG